MKINEQFDVFIGKDGDFDRIEISYKGLMIAEVFGHEQEDGTMAIVTEIGDGTSPQQHGWIPAEDWKKDKVKINSTTISLTHGTRTENAPFWIDRAEGDKNK
jgi:hypothetical protein